MSYLKANFIPGRGVPGKHVSPDQMAIHMYYSATDAADDIYLDTTYFPPYFGFDADIIKIGDILYISGVNKDAAFILTNLTDFTYFSLASTPTLIGALQFINKQLTVTGSTYLPPNNTTQVFIQAINNAVTATFPTFLESATANSTITLVDVFPAGYKPVNSISKPIAVSNGSPFQITTFGYASYDLPSNTITIAPVSSLGPGADTYGYYTFTFDYLITAYTNVT